MITLSKENLSGNANKSFLKAFTDFCRYEVEQEYRNDVEQDIIEEYREKHPCQLPCPVWQCGGEMQIMNRQRPIKGDSDNEESAWQMPNLVCNNCRAVYRFMQFMPHSKWKKLKTRKSDRRTKASYNRKKLIRD